MPLAMSLAVREAHRQELATKALVYAIKGCERLSETYRELARKEGQAIQRLHAQLHPE